MTGRAYIPHEGWCDPCQKRSYADRSTARRVIRAIRHRDGKPRAYRCAQGKWHVGHAPQRLIEGKVSRAQVANSKRQERP